MKRILVGRHSLFLLLGFWIVIQLLGFFNLAHRPRLAGEILARASGPGLMINLADGETVFIQTADDIPVASAHLFELVVESRKAGESLRVHSRDGSIYELPVAEGQSPWRMLIDYLTAMLFLLLGSFILARNTGTQGRLFFAVAFSFSLIIGLSWPGVGHPEIGWIVVIFFSVFYPISFALLLIFGLHFPAEISSVRFRKWVIRLAFSLALILAVAFLLVTIRRYRYPDFDSFRLYHYFYRAFRTILLVYLAAALVAMIAGAVRSAERPARLRFYWVAGGIFIGGFPFLFLWNLPQIFNRMPLVPEWMTEIALLFIPLSIAIAILRYRLFDIEFYLNRGIVYTVTISILLLIYSGLVAGTSYLISRKLTTASPVLASISAVCVALIFFPLRTRVQTSVDRRFFRIRYNQFVTLQSLLDRLPGCNSVDEILILLTQSLQNVLPVAPNCVVNVSLGKAITIPGGGDLSCPSFDWLNSLTIPKVPIVFNASCRHLLEKEVGQFIAGIPEEIVLVSRVDEDYYWCIGRKAAGTRFWVEDVDLIREFSLAASLSVQRLQVLEKLAQERAEKEAAEHLSRWKSLLVSEVAHNFRSPLNTLIWKLRPLHKLGTSDEDPVRRGVEAVEGQVKKLQFLVESLLNLANVESGRLKISPTSVRIATAVSRIEQDLQRLIVEKGIEVVIKGDRQFMIRTDETLFTQVLQNIVENALKYSPAESSVFISWQKRGGDPPEAVVCVEDQGPGISTDSQELLFTPFASRSPAGGKAAGLHLGLYMARQFTLALGGELKIDSAPGQGTRVELIFPLGFTENAENTG